MKAALSDVSARGVWTDEQRRALKSAFTALGAVLEKLILLKGVVSTQNLSMETLPLSMDVAGSSRPAAVVVLSAMKVSDGTVISMPPILWSYTPGTQNTVQIVNIDLDAGEDYELTILTVESAS